MKKTVSTTGAPAAIGPYSQAAALPKNALLEIDAIAGK